MDYAELSRGVHRALTPAPGWPAKGAVVRDLLLMLGMSLLLFAESFAFSAVGYDQPVRALFVIACAGLAIVLSRTYPLLAPCLAVFVCMWSQAFLVVLLCANVPGSPRTCTTPSVTSSA